jgi:hypothetical protein
MYIRRINEMKLSTLPTLSTLSTLSTRGDDLERVSVRRPTKV